MITLNEEPVTKNEERPIPFPAELWRELGRPEGKRVLSASVVEYMAAVIGHQFGVERSEILGRSRIQVVADARKVLYWFLRERTVSGTGEQSGWLRIGRALGKDHGTIMHGCRWVEDFRAINRQFAERIEKLTEVIG